MSKNGLILLKPTSIAYTGTSATVSANGSVSFSAISSLSLNGVFSADYDNYMVVFRASNNSTTTVAARLRSAGTDNSTGSSYVREALRVLGSSLSGQRATGNYWDIFVVGYATQRVGAVGYLYGPYLSQPTAFRTVGAYDYLGASMYDSAGTHSQSDSYDGITLLPNAGSFTGRVAVYGMRK
jgi:hypothetical protein